MTRAVGLGAAGVVPVCAGAVVAVGAAVGAGVLVGAGVAVGAGASVGSSALPQATSTPVIRITNSRGRDSLYASRRFTFRSSQVFDAVNLQRAHSPVNIANLFRRIFNKYVTEL